jgi:hypothetical protein
VSLSEIEYSALRQTIATRGTARMLLLPVTMIAWAATSLVVLLFNDLPILSLFPLAVLVGGFEAIHALHVGVERIGRYVQVFYEAGTALPRWETTAMSVGPALPGGGVDPLFTVVFLTSAVLNLLSALLPRPTAIEAAAVMVLHAAFAFRVVRAYGAATKQRAVELESYRALRVSEGDRP